MPNHYAYHQGVQRLVKDLNRLYKAQQALHQYDFDPRGFEWIDCHDAPQSILSYLRWDDGDFRVVILNFTPVVRRGYRIGVPRSGAYREVFNSDSRFYGGSDVGNGQEIASENVAWMGRTCSLSLTLPPLGALVLKPAEAGADGDGY